MTEEELKKKCIICNKRKQINNFKRKKKICITCNDCQKEKSKKICDMCYEPKFIGDFFRDHSIHATCNKCVKGSKERIEKGYEVCFNVFDKVKEKFSDVHTN